FSSRRRHTRFSRDWSSDVCSSDLDPHPVRGDVLLPGQVLASVLVVPGQHGAAELLGAHRLNRPLSASLSSGLTLSPSFSSIFSRSEERRVGKECRGRRTLEP